MRVCVRAHIIQGVAEGRQAKGGLGVPQGSVLGPLLEPPLESLLEPRGRAELYDAPSRPVTNRARMVSRIVEAGDGPTSPAGDTLATLKPFGQQSETLSSKPSHSLPL